MKRQQIISGLSLVLAAALSGCDGSSESNSTSDDSSIERNNGNEAKYAAVIATAASDFGSSDIEIVDLKAEPLSAINGLASTAESDITVAAHGGNYYRIGRFNIDNITKWNITDTTAMLWQYSARTADEVSANPYDLIFASKTKAYLIRLDSPLIWIVNPEAAVQAEFKIGEIDMSAYSDSDGLPEVAGGVIADGKLYVHMQRLNRDNNFAPENTAYVAVIDTTTDTEIDTQQDNGVLKGIPLTTRNPQRIEYLNDTGVLVQSVGNFFPAEYTGGIEKIDINDFSTTLLIDDGDDSNHPYGQISNFVLVDSETAYFLGYAGWQNISLFRFNPVTGEVADEAVSGYQGLDLRGLSVSPEGQVWISIASDMNPRISILDPATDMEVDSVDTYLNPAKVVFVSE